MKCDIPTRVIKDISDITFHRAVEICRHKTSIPERLLK